MVKFLVAAEPLWVIRGSKSFVRVHWWLAELSKILCQLSEIQPKTRDHRVRSPIRVIRGFRICV